MLRIARFGGLVTYASPYAVPPGGAVSQVNLTCAVPGQLTTRGGVKALEYTGAPRAPQNLVTQLFTAPGGVGKGDKLIVIEEDGSVMLSPSVL